jgi:hypothetical protein
MNANNSLSRYELTATLGSAFGYGWRVMSKYFLELFLVSIILIAVSSPIWITNVLDNYHNPAVIMLKIFAIAYGIFVVSAFDYGAKYVNLRAARDEKIDMKDVLASFDMYLNVILSNLLVSAIVIAGMFLLVVPGIIFAVKLTFVPYLVIDKGLDPVEAVKQSWDMTKGHGWTIFGMAVISIFIYIAGILVLILGVFISGMWVSASFASLYHAVDRGEFGDKVVEVS